ncbi:mitochondrial carrier [Suillus paluster]|uniref:mitochondrial carrier n=1 Tax=Suillus paluster TaxID=48578 RepID=UPI001B87B2F0|nr:mitochondrial carrier [Suillus paluster]KAG1730545.1 mitochondrial carrier [Suillus paluster]
MLSLLDMIFVLGPLGLSHAILVPLVGTLVRFRAHYNPKGLQLQVDSEADVQPHTGPVISSFFAMLRRVHKIEGWPGLYKGLIPSLLSNLSITFFFLLMIFLSGNNLRLGTYSTPGADVVGMLFYSIFGVLVYLPKIVITNRAITTPHKLPYFNAIYSLRVLLTPTERRKPWILYLTPGLLATQVAHTAYVAIFVVIVLLSRVILTPLEVIAVRLSIQRNCAAPEINPISQENDGDAEEATEYSGVDEDVIGLRTGMEPYVGVIDCAKRIIEEEGWSTLYRAWWLMLAA